MGANDVATGNPKPSTFQRIVNHFREFGEWLAAGHWVYGAIAFLVIGALILPPVSLPQRLHITGYTRLSAKNPSVSHPDGITVSVNPEDRVSLRVRLDSIPQAIFMQGSAGADLQAALAAIPLVLQVKSPFYRIQTGSRTTGPATIEVVIPNDAEPWETLDLYTWTGATWEWVGGTLDREREVLIAHVDRLPSSVVVMQTLPVIPAVGTVASGEAVSGPAASLLTQVMLPGLYLGPDGMLIGRSPTPPSGSPEALLLVGNRPTGHPLNRALLEDLLTNPEIQARHIAEILSRAPGYTGVALNYEGLMPEQREAFSAFVAALAQALHAQGLRLEVMVPAPSRTEAGWDPGGYDWAALGRAADALIFPLPDNPNAYTEGGAVQSLIEWAVGQVGRYRLRAAVSSLSADSGPEGVRYVSLEEALAPFGQVQPPAGPSVQPGQELVFTLVGQITSITPMESAGTYAIAYKGTQGESRTVWLGTPSFLARKLDWALRYHLGGVVVHDLLSPGNMPGVVEAVDGYRVAAGLPQPTALEVVWTVEGPQTTEERVTLSQPEFRWKAPEAAGTYTVSAAIAGVSRGSVQVNVAAPTPTPMPIPTPAATGAAMTAAPACLQAAFVTDVTVPDGTKFNNNETFKKTWRLRNSGTCDWPQDAALVFASGEKMGGPDSVPVGVVKAGATVDISVDLKAPANPGRYTGLWYVRAGGAKIPGSDVSVVIQAGEVASVPAPAPGVRGNFELGGHVADFSFPYAAQMRYAGMNWVKTQIRYPADASGVIAAAHAAGFKIQVSALGPANMTGQPGFEQEIARWVARMAAAGADAIEVWNEPNLDREWQNGLIHPANYTKLLCAAYQAIKAANPGTAVISAAPAPTGFFGGCHPHGCDDKPWMEGLFAAGAANCLDYLGAHYNAGATPPSARSGHPADGGDRHHSWYFLPQTELYYHIFRGTRQLFYTELGYASQEGVEPFPDNFWWARGNDNSEQAAWLAESVRLSIQTGMVRCIIVWNVDFLRPIPGDPQNGYAIIRPGGACPACEALHAVLGSR
ncbi:MAG: NBR1-Ig-like domain-containing protein [Anaerolineae bacterium]|nr:NBR1-Ig-like domain-containing protein [Anaerolineae bacterium]MDW8068109.1 NBR1-Ig-like domain-containing protein [Anaerolineae bacterium]